MLKGDFMNEIVEYLPNMYATFWALIPPLVAIILALITKEVYSSLFIGIVMGGFMGIFSRRDSAWKNLSFIYLMTEFLEFLRIRIM
jgi:tetracycline resistance efflux pump